MSMGWYGWVTRGGSIAVTDIGGRIQAAVNADGRQEVFAVSPLGLPQTIWQTQPNSWSGSSWAGLADLQDVKALPTVAINKDGRIEVFVVYAPGETSGGIFDHMWQTTPGNGWSKLTSMGVDAAWPQAHTGAQWDSLGGSFSAIPPSATNNDVTVYAVGRNGDLQYNRQV